MINKKVFEDEILANMESNLRSSVIKIASIDLEKAINNLQSAAEIFEDLGFNKKSDQITNILISLANKIDDKLEFNMSDDGGLLNLDINDADLEVLEDEVLSEMDFEDEL